MGTFIPENRGELKASYFTLGCKLNFAETASIGQRLSTAGIREAKKGESPDICIVNTCSVTQMADKKARSLIRRISRMNPDTLLVVTGCYAQLKPEEVAKIPGVDIVLGSKEKHHILDYIEDIEKKAAPLIAAGTFSSTDEFSPSCSRGDRTRFFLKVQDGCDYYCTYCTIPYARGRSRSGNIADIESQARRAAAEGGKEIVITGVNIGDFGKNTGESLMELLKVLDNIKEIERYRISSIEPNLLTDEIIEWIACGSRAYMPHFHIPLQSGSDIVLRKMNRHYDTALFASRISKIKTLIPDAFIGVDIIAGARGETEEEWNKTIDFIESLDISRLHVFPYSERPGTAALKLDQAVSIEERNMRAARLIEISDRKLERFMHDNIGLTRPVLWEHAEGADRELMSGLTDNYLRVVAPYDETMLNTVTPALLTEIDSTRPETIKGLHSAR